MEEKDFNTIFSKNLIHFLQINNMTQAELAERLGVSTATTSNWCNGIKLPRMDKVDRMTKIFNCLRSDLLEDKGFLIGQKNLLVSLFLSSDVLLLVFQLLLLKKLLIQKKSPKPSRKPERSSGCRFMVILWNLNSAMAMSLSSVNKKMLNPVISS